MEIMITFLFIAVAFAALIYGSQYKDPLFVFVAGVFFLFLGLGIWVGGIEIGSGTTEVHELTSIVDGNTTIESGSIEISKNYSEYNGVASRSLGTVLILLSLYLSFLAWEYYKE